ncbi:MAG: hypothetical protein K0R34_4031 [Herbinix sp.]|jgi:hypothetical protein|nr:hypothetical protein [Herbinix sp.]
MIYYYLLLKSGETVKIEIVIRDEETVCFCTVSI